MTLGLGGRFKRIIASVKCYPGYSFDEISYNGRRSVDNHVGRFTRDETRSSDVLRPRANGRADTHTHTHAPDTQKEVGLQSISVDLHDANLEANESLAVA